jgi:outer membrane biogenesis lipoprotein LolB
LLWSAREGTAGTWILLLSAAILLQGCAGILRGPPDDLVAREVVMNLDGHNPELGQFKGLIEIRIEAGGQTMAGRAAWAAAVPERLRIEWLSMLGQPILTLAGDGETITLISHVERSYRQLPQSRASMQQLIRFPASIEDLVTLLRGRPLIPAFFSARQLDGRSLALMDRWYNTLATLSLDDQDRLQTQQLFTPQGELRYRIEWQQWQAFDQVIMPRRMILTAPSGERMTLTLVRLWTENAFEPSMFFLERPDFMAE